MRDSAIPGLAVGFFDGVHRGHQAIVAQADRVLTFRNHPLSVLRPDRAPRLIMSSEERIQALYDCGVKEVIALEFTPELADLEPAEFVRKYLSGRICCGDNWRFGRGGRGDAQTLRSLGLTATTIPYAMYEGRPISSTRIREALESGAIESAEAMLGHTYRLRTRCEAGKGKGRKLGFPTVNLRPQFLELQLPHGVYAVECKGRKAIANFGVAPTFGQDAWSSPLLEVHFLEDVPEIGTDSVEIVSIRRFIRSERIFESIEALKTQIALDCEQVKKFKIPSCAH